MNLKKKYIRIKGGKKIIIRIKYIVKEKKKELRMKKKLKLLSSLKFKKKIKHTWISESFIGK